jgi:hypothetical protein
MNKLFCVFLASSLLFSVAAPKYSTTAVVTLIGAKIKSAQREPTIVKYKRKDCPVCKGKGWYMSGDDIKKIECTYCEPDNEQQN